MASQHASRRSRKLRRRVSSALTGWSNGSPKSAPSPIGRRISLSPVRRNADNGYQRPHLTDGSDYEDYQEISTRSLRGRSTSPTRSIFQNRPPPTAYASLPPTPIEPSRPFSPPTPVSPISPGFRDTSSVQLEHEPFDAPFSLWDYLREELLATDFDSHQELKWERVSNFLSIPLAMEQVRRSLSFFKPISEISEQIIGFGFVLCFDSFLYTFTILPIRFVLALLPFITNIFRRSAPPLPPSQKADLLRALLLIISLLILNPLTDASKIYHSIRGQETIKLYVIFNALEVCGSYTCGLYRPNNNFSTAPDC